ncbi:MAG TPA: NADPH-dependent FMN reductase [Kofleriaceae bacterium]|nr:NADPH-dependent FMN reductase [Kofleriaceae bacterium]
MRVLGISGSTSAKSSNTALLRAASRVAPPGTEIVIYEGMAGLPHFNPDLDVEPLPAPVAALRAQVGTVDALAICSPEYAHGVPGALKNTLDWLVSALEPIGKPVLLISASPSGAAYAHAQLLEVLRTMMGAHLVDGGAHMFSRSKLDASGGIAAPDLVDALTRGFAQLAEACAVVAAANA